MEKNQSLAAFPVESLTSNNEDVSPDRKELKFELHYEDSAANARSVLHAILEELASHSKLHNWDDKEANTPLKSLTRAVRNALPDKSSTALISSANVLQIFTRRGDIERKPNIQESENVLEYFFHSHSDPSGNKSEIEPSSEGASLTPEISNGRVIYVQAFAADAFRLASLFMHPFCLRLQSEDYAFVQRFIERHLGLQRAFRAPEYLQVRSPTEFGFNQCYKRVTLSCHIPSLFLENYNADVALPIDRKVLSRFGLEKSNLRTGDRCLVQTSSSVILTLVNPEETRTNQEERILLQNPEALWTVMVANNPGTDRPNDEILSYLTPIAQFVRGIVIAVASQKSNFDTILQAIQTEVDQKDDRDLFDDQEFSKSRLYHWTIATYTELITFIELNVRFLKRITDVHLKKLVADSHPYEAHGTTHWMAKLEESVFDLGQLIAQIGSLQGQVQEKRNALHGATAVLAARAALQQGDRMKILTYLATAYLPIATVASVYSMSVLPNSATLGSFFVVLAMFLILTLLAGVAISHAQNSAERSSLHITQPLKLLRSLLGGLSVQWRPYVQTYRRAMVAPVFVLDFEGAGQKQYEEELEEIELNLGKVQIQVVGFLRVCVMPQIQVPGMIWHRFRYRNHPGGGMSWDPFLFVVHALVFICWPFLALLLVGGITLIMVLDLIDFMARQFLRFI